MELQQSIAESARGNTVAQKTVFDYLAPTTLMLCRRYVRNTDDAEELLLNAFHKFFRALDGFEYRGEEALRSWLKTIAINECLMFLRRKNMFVIGLEPDGQEVALDADILAKLDARDILRLITDLPSGYRTVFNLYEMEGMPHKEIAALLGISEGTSKSQLSKAKAVLQKRITQTYQHYAKRKTR